MTLTTGARKSPASPVRRTRLAGISALAITLAVSGCGESEKKVPLPSASSVPGGSASSPAPTAAVSLSAEEAVKKAYVDFGPIADKAVTAPPEQIRPLLEKYVQRGPYLDFLVRDDLSLQENGRAPSKDRPVNHITKVTVSGRQAVLNDCRDDSKASVVDKKTGKIIPGTLGKARQKVIAKLAQGGDGGWLINEVRSFPGACSRP